MSLSYIYKLINYLSKDKKTIIAQDKKHLQALIKKEMLFFGSQCNLNHIDVSNITDMSYLFHKSKFNGDISNWNTSNVVNMEAMFADSIFINDISNWDISSVKNMSDMFYKSKFNNIISGWNVSNVEKMYYMFANSDFNGDISKWNTSNVENMTSMFIDSKFNGDISQWHCINVINISEMFYKCTAPVPYWVKIDNFLDRRQAIEVYHTQKTLQKTIGSKSNNKSILKI